MVGINTSITHGLIVAAGDGDRMGELTRDCPKVLLPMNNRGEPLILSPIRALASVGIKNIAIVVGYLADEVRYGLGNGSQYGVNLHYINNPDYLGGNAISVLKAMSWTSGKPVVLCMGDHIIEPKIIRRLISTNHTTNVLCVESRPALHCDIEEATKVALFEDGTIRDIGKNLRHWDAIDTGVFLLTEKFFTTIEELSRLRGNNIEISDVIRFMVARRHNFHTCEMSNCWWMDVDIKEDLKLVQSQGVLDDQHI